MDNSIQETKKLNEQSAQNKGQSGAAMTNSTSTTGSMTNSASSDIEEIKRLNSQSVQNKGQSK